MAIRSFLLSLIVTCWLAYALTFGLTDPHSLLKRLPSWVALPGLLAGGLAYLLAIWWACRGFRQHKLFALASLGFCALGLSVYALGIALEMTGGRASKGQYDYDFATLAPAEKALVSQIAQGTGLQLQNAVFTEHWHVAETPVGGSFRICVQKGHVTALNFSGHPVGDLQPFSRLPSLSDLYLRRCGLSDLSDLRSTLLERLEVSDNQIADLKTLGGCPNLRWLVATNNRLQSADGLDQFRQMVSYDFAGNPLSSFPEKFAGQIK